MELTKKHQLNLRLMLLIFIIGLFFLYFRGIKIHRLQGPPGLYTTNSTRVKRVFIDQNLPPGQYLVTKYLEIPLRYPQISRRKYLAL